jgi:hypothetical protein
VHARRNAWLFRFPGYDSDVREAVGSRLLAAGGLLATLLVPASLGVTGAAAASSRTASIPDITVLFGRGMHIIRATNRPTFARAVVYEADGSTRGDRVVDSAAGIVRWRFVFDNTASRSRFASATLRRVERHTSPWPLRPTASARRKGDRRRPAFPKTSTSRARRR